ncbi:MAG: LysE family transporter [Desulfopila sp.]|jgi:threonine/homoserine/homoserine lactone efflux protein|nr:LysE family transporter [Desulfopila sp.]
MLPAIITIFFSSFVIALSGALMPGPLLSVTISESSRRGVVTGPLMIAGHGLLELGVVAALLSGLAPLLLREDVFVAISFVGGTILLWMAFSMLRELPQLRFCFAAEEKRQRNLVAAGIVLSAVNPYFILWWASIGFGYIVYSARFGAIGIAAFFLGHILADFVWYTAVSYGVHKGKNFLTDRGYRRLMGACALFLGLFSGYFFYSGIDKLI